MDTLLLIVFLVVGALLAWMIRREANVARANRAADLAVLEILGEKVAGSTKIANSAVEKSAETALAVSAQERWLKVQDKQFKERYDGQSERLDKLAGVVSQNTDVQAALEMQIRRYPVVAVRKKGKRGKWAYLATAEVIDPATGEVMPATPVTLPEAGQSPGKTARENAAALVKDSEVHDADGEEHDNGGG